MYNLSEENRPNHSSDCFWGQKLIVAVIVTVTDVGKLGSGSWTDLIFLVVLLQHCESVLLQDIFEWRNDMR